MNERWPPALRERLVAARLFLVTASTAIVAGGLLAAIMAHASTRPVMWVVAYLVLVVGVAQAVLGIGQALLPVRLPTPNWRIGHWLAFNLGSIGVIIGRLLEARGLVTTGTAVFLLALLGFFLAVRRVGSGWLALAFHGVLWITALGALTGLGLSLTGLVR